MRDIASGVLTVIVVLAWLAGIVYAKGGLSTLCASLFPPYAWYLVVEHSMKTLGLV